MSITPAGKPLVQGARHVGLALALLGGVSGNAFAQDPAVLSPFQATQLPQEPQSPVQIPDVIPARQVTLFGVLATPTTAGERPARDEKLATIEPQLRKLVPNHTFRLLNVQSRRLMLGQALTCDLGDGFVASTTLLHPFDENGKVQLRCSLTYQQVPQIERLVGTPPNQLFFCEKPLPSGQRLLLGIGAR